MEGDLFFGSAEIFLEQARSIAADPNLKVIILRRRNALNFAATCAMAIEQLLRFTRERDRHLLVCGAHPEVIEIFRNSGLLRILDPENVFCEDSGNPNRSHGEALKRIRQLLGRNLDIRLFVGEGSAARKSPA